MQDQMKRRIIWFSVFMLWIGMVVSIMVYQERNDGTTPTTITENTPGTQARTEATGHTSGTSDNAQGINTGSNNSNSTTGGAQGADTKNKTQVSEEDFFMSYRLDRDKSRSEQTSNYRDLINNPNTDQTNKKKAQEAMLRLTQTIEQESQVENLIKGRGYADAFASIQSDSAKVIVLAPGLKDADAAKIMDIVQSVTKLPPESIDIIPRWDKN